MADIAGAESLELEDGQDVELDDLAGQELFDVPEDLQGDAPTGAPDPGAPADPAKAGPPAAKPGSPQPRDTETGKFVPKDAAPATDEGQPPEPLQADPSAPPPAADAAGAPEDEAEPELEFSFRADGQTVQIPGSKVTKEGIFIPREYAPDVQRLLSHGRTYQGSYKQRLTEAYQEVANVKAEVQEDVERARAILTFWADLADRTEKGERDQETGLTPIEKWIEGFARNRVQLEAEATLAAAKAYENRQPPGPVNVPGFEDDEGPAAELAPEELEEQLQAITQDLGNHLVAIARADGIRGLTGAELTRIRDWMSAPERVDQFYKRALADIPKEESGLAFDIKKGQLVPLADPIRATLKHQAGLILDARRSAADLQAAQNRNAANGKGNPIPPVTTVDGKGVPKKAAETPKFKTKAEMEAWFNSNEGDPAT